MFMCECHFKSDEEKALANEAEVERCFCARTHNSFEEVVSAKDRRDLHSGAAKTAI